MGSYDKCTLVRSAKTKGAVVSLYIMILAQTHVACRCGAHAPPHVLHFISVRLVSIRALVHA